MPFLTLDGRKVHYQQTGRGPDVVLIHGVTGDLSIWFLCGATKTLSARHRVTVYDLRGHGYSDAPPTGYTSADHADDLLRLMDAVGVERAALVGHSFGGVIAAHAAADAPDRVGSLVLSDPYFPALRHLEDVSRWGHWEAFRQEALDAGVELSGEHWYDLGRFFDQIAHLDDARKLKLRQAVGLPGLNRLIRLGGTTCGDDTKVEAGLTVDRLRAIDVPVLAVYGAHSPFLATAAFLAEQLPHCRSVQVPDAKHRAPEENGPAFVAIVDAFLAEVARPGAAAVPA
jgi:pimeloyl-ACP methyl ester carboxylesterase